MAIDISALNVTDVAMTPSKRGRQAVDTGPNPVLDNGWLMDSFRTGQAKGITLPGTIETYRPVIREDLEAWAVERGHVKANGELTRDARKHYLAAHGGQGEGPEKERLTGDAAQLVKWIREAADLNEIGASIQWEAKGKTKVLVKFLGQKRKASKGEDE